MGGAEVTTAPGPGVHGYTSSGPRGAMLPLDADPFTNFHLESVVSNSWRKGGIEITYTLKGVLL